MSDKITSFQFDANQHNPSQAFDTLPLGWYVGQVVDAEVRPTRTPGGMFIAATFEILHPEFAAGRKIWANYNVQNANAQAVEIGMNELAALSISSGVPQFNDVQQLQMRPLHIKLKVTKPKEADDEPRNEVCGYESVNKPVKYATAPNVAAQNKTMAPPPGFGNQAPNAFPGQPAQQAPAQQGFAASTQPSFAAQQQPAQPQVNAAQQPAAQPWNQAQAPQQPQAPAQTAQQPVQAGTQPWNQAQAPVTEAPVQQPPQTQQPAWGQQQVDPAAQAAANATQQAGQAAQPTAPQEPAHPAQQAPAPWQAGAGQPTAPQEPAPWNQPAQQ